MSTGQIETVCIVVGCEPARLSPANTCVIRFDGHASEGQCLCCDYILDGVCNFLLSLLLDVELMDGCTLPDG